MSSYFHFPNVTHLASEEEAEGNFQLNLAMTVVCVIFAALAAGLTMGLVSLEPLQMKILLETKEEDCRDQQEVLALREEKGYAKRVMPLISRHHLLLVTLLIVNAGANECLPIFLDKLVPTSVAILLSITCVLFFGEIIPSAIFTGSNQLKIAAMFSPVVWFFTIVTFPISYPLSKVLDYVLGDTHDDRYNIAELKALVKLHRRSHIVEESTPMLGESGLTSREVSIVHGAMDLTHSRARDIAIPLNKVFMLESEDCLDFDCLVKILAKGHSRVPIYSKNKHNIRGLLLVKKLIVVDQADERKISSLQLRQPVFVTPETSLMELLSEFEKGKSHLAVVTDNPSKVKMSIKYNQEIPPNIHMSGICTLEDVVEALIHKQITDEFDGGVKKLLRDSKLKAQLASKLTAIASTKGYGAVERSNPPSLDADDLEANASSRPLLE